MCLSINLFSVPRTMDSKEGSDEECLDLEALEALLEKDDNDQEDDQQMSDGTESPNRSSKGKLPVSVCAFLYTSNLRVIFHLKWVLSQLKSSTNNLFFFFF